MTYIFFTVFILIICSVLLGMHMAIYRGAITIFSLTSTSTILAAKIILALLPLSFLFSFFLVSRYNNIFTQTLYTISASWIGIAFYFFLAVLIFYLIKLFGIAGSSQTILWIGKTLIMIAALVGIYGIYNAKNVVITRKEVHLSNLADSWKGKRAVFYSDVHLGQILDEKFAAKVAQKIKDLNPDIIFNGGDLYDGVKVEEMEIIKPFAELKAPLGHFFITGNHEEYGNTREFLNAIRNSGMEILDNRKTIINGLQIIGVDYVTTANKESFAKILDDMQINPNEPSILLKHTPFNLDVAEKASISLQLSGHTHRAQVFPLSLLTKLIYKGYDYGSKKYGKMQVMVSSGAGTWGPPLRVGTQAEIMLITFK